jgi:DNA-binding SARP family transcriptional activator
MKESAPALAKLTRPRLHSPVAREHLFAKLDALRTYPMVWVNAPPGAGKTTLVASWLETRKFPVVWYHVDADDREPATFFHFLAQSVQSTSRVRKSTLPLFPTETDVDVFPFARRFFRSLCASLLPGTVLVLDNCHSATGEIFHTLLAVAVSELPRELNIVCISRGRPPAELGRLVANRELATLDWESLRLTVEETHAIARFTNPDAPSAAAVHAAAGGWAAGVVLMLAHWPSTVIPQGGTVGIPRESLFDYFAGEIFSKSTPQDRETLLRIATLPHFTAETAIAVSGNPHAGRLIEQLYRQQYFVDKHEGAQTSYRYHDLYREFLLDRLTQSRGADGCATLRRQAANILETVGETELAVSLYIDSSAWAEAARVLGMIGSRLVKQGRWQALRNWIESMPDVVTVADPWLLYWLGYAKKVAGDPCGSSELEHAYRLFKERGDDAGRLQVADALLHVPENFEYLEDVLPLLRHLIGDGDRDAPDARAILAAHNLLNVFMLCDPGNPEMRALASVLRNWLGDERLSAEERVTAGGALEYYAWLTADVNLSREIIPLVGAAANREDVSPLRRWRWFYFKGLNAFGQGELDEGSQTLEHAAILAAQSGLERARRRTMIIVTQWKIAQGDLPGCESLLQDLRGAIRDGDWPEGPHFRQLRAYLALHKGFREEAVSEAEAALTGVDRHTPKANRIYIRTVLASLYTDLGNHERALQLIVEARTIRKDTSVALFDDLLAWAEAYAELTHGDVDRARKLIREVLGRARGSGYVGRLALVGLGLPRMLATAMEANIEPDFVRQLIGRFRVKPPSSAAGNWPWPVRIQALGGFLVEIDGQPLSGQGKSRHRLLEALRLIVASGARGIDTGRLAQLLWPDAEGDTAQNNLSSTVHRLRKLLGRDDSFIMHDGILMLNADVCWLDATAFDHLLSATTEAGPLTDETAVSRAECALCLYKGHLLPNESKPWASPARERLRVRVIKHALALGQAHELEGRFEQATRVYERALELDPSSEKVYRHLMLSLKADGRIDEATDVFLRCRRALSATLATAPSSDTVAVYQSLRNS